MRKEFRMLAACEHSGVVADAFKDLGWLAYSCDLKPSPGRENHFHCNIYELQSNTWDLLIGFPPCTYLSYAGNGVWSDDVRTRERINAMNFFFDLWEWDVKHICLENPRGIMYKVWRQPDQEVHPYYFGDPYLKRTGLWLKNLPLLTYQTEPTLFDTITHNPKPKPVYYGKNGKPYHWVDKHGGDKDTQENRSIFSKAIAQAMATQWTNYICGSDSLI
jgi:site-specific DNA-cytosine methylase